LEFRLILSFGLMLTGGTALAAMTAFKLYNTQDRMNLRKHLRQVAWRKQRTAKKAAEEAAAAE
jgi:hypothetical protein